MAYIIILVVPILRTGPDRANIFFGRGFNFEIFLDIYFLRIIKNSWLLWRLFAARDVRLGHSMCSTFLYCTKNEDLIIK